jgi:hypothetical protein
MRHRYTTIFVITTTAMAVLAVILFAAVRAV